MGYIRVCRPGSVIGPQQHYLLHYAPRLLEEGRALRRAQKALEDAARGPAEALAARNVVRITADARAAADTAQVLVPTGAPLRRSPRHASRGGEGAEQVGAMRSGSSSSMGSSPAAAAAGALSRMEIADGEEGGCIGTAAGLPAQHAQ